MNNETSKKESEVKNDFYTADLHFGQESLLATGKWKERPFSTLEEMHKDQIKKWNKKVTNGDDVYVLGDVGSRGYHHMHPGTASAVKRSETSYPWKS